MASNTADRDIEKRKCDLYDPPWWIEFWTNLTTAPEFLKSSCPFGLIPTTSQPVLNILASVSGEVEPRHQESGPTSRVLTLSVNLMNYLYPIFYRFIKT